jgi:hypothetical protein
VDQSFSRLTDEELLDLRLSDLPLRIEGTLIEKRIARLCRELKTRRIAFRPHVWISEEWFTPDGVGGFAIPFYIVHPRLIKLERNQMLQVEGESENECMRILRHETGHAMDNAFRLHARRSWQDAFGSHRVAYPDWYQPQPNSRDYVLNLDSWYAQSHPAEDFAETFAVWLKPGKQWRKDYEGWGALRKLQYVDDLMADVGRRKPVRALRSEVDALRKLRSTLREHYRRKRAYYSIDWPASYDRNLFRIFAADSHKNSSEPAARFLRRIGRDLCRVVAQGTGVHNYTINHILKDMIERCRERDLRVAMPEDQARRLCIVALTTQTMQVVGTGYHRIPL